MLDRLEPTVMPGADDSARNALHEEAMKNPNKTPETNSAGASTKPQSNTDKTAMTANEQRKAEEEKFFRDFYENSNFELDQMKNGEGPFQSLEHMVEEGKIKMSHERIADEAKRIAERDFKDLGRNYYKSSDLVKFYSEKEIDKNVQEMVEKVKGIDVSNWQGNINWKAVKDAGYQFAFMKATEGTWFTDKTFDANRKGAREAGLKVGYYHYFHPDESVDQQVKYFCNKVGKAEPDALRLVIDAEDPGKWTRYPLNQRVKMVDDFLKGVQKELGMTPEVAIYCSPNFADEILGNSPILKDYSLWIANYGVNQPRTPGPWGDWDFWQFTDRGRVPGIQGPVDIDVFNGTDLSQDQLKTETRSH